MSENLNYVGDGFEIKDGSLVIFDAEEYFGVDEFCCSNGGIEEFCDIVIPRGVVSIGKGAFLGCSSLRSVIITSGVVSIEAEAFKGCCNLSSVLFSDVCSDDSDCSDCSDCSEEAKCSDEAKDDDCVDDSEKMEKGQGVKIIGREAFAGCVSLEKLDLPNSLIFVGEGAFSGLKNLELLTTPENLELSENVWGCISKNTMKY